MKPRFLADANLKRAIVDGLVRREPSIDFLSAEDANIEGIPDPEVLRLATFEGRILVSHDFRTMPAHFRDFVAGQKCSGVILISQKTPVGPAVAALFEIWALTDAAEWENRLEYVPL